MTEEIVTENKLQQWRLDLRAFNILQTIQVTAHTREEAYEIAAKKLIQGVLYVPPPMMKDTIKTLDYCADMVFKETGINIQTIRSVLRAKNIVVARHALIWLATREGVDKASIGWYINRDRSTNYNSIEVVEDSHGFAFDKTYKWLKKVPTYEQHHNRD
jgi:chromosomal replication initiation ATPase DnaA